MASLSTLRNLPQNFANLLTNMVPEPSHKWSYGAPFSRGVETVNSKNQLVFGASGKNFIKSLDCQTVSNISTFQPPFHTFPHPQPLKQNRTKKHAARISMEWDPDAKQFIGTHDRCRGSWRNGGRVFGDAKNNRLVSRV